MAIGVSTGINRMFLTLTEVIANCPLPIGNRLLVLFQPSAQPLRTKSQVLLFLRTLSHGFAARCGAMALPRRNHAFFIWASPLVRAPPLLDHNQVDADGRSETRPGAQPIMRDPAARLVAALLLRVLCASAVMEVDTKTARGAEKAEFAQRLDPL